MSIVDMRGNFYHEGCEVVRSISDGHLQICKVTKIEDGKLYLNNSKIPIRYPRRMVIITQDPLYNMVKKYDSKQ